MSASPGVPVPLGPGPRTAVHRMAERGRYDRATIHAILDEALVGHLGFLDRGVPVVVPTVYGRVDDALYLHGAPANAALRAAARQGPVCLTVSLVDGLVLARSAFHHSLNYRSVMAFGAVATVSGLAERRAAALAILEHVVPGRSTGTRLPTDAELRATRIVRFDIEEASAKVRTGGPRDEPEDLVRPEVWAGEVPLVWRCGTPVADTTGPVTEEVPDHVRRYTRPGWEGRP
jgi:nitroimidazol reductase NimA-like FMN-containing flavoprotein (pyridoxamine 5'-phosphate oxidase superfamily)